MKTQYFVTHSAGMCHCDSISRELEDGSYEDLSYQEIVDKLNENQQLKKQYENSVKISARIQARNDKLNDENEELKKENRELRNELRHNEKMYYRSIVDKLNENQQLKQENERLSRLNEAKRQQIKFHVDGYNQLKEVNKHSEETIKKQHELIKQLSQENCKIHQIIREAVNTERTELGQSVLKNLADNIGVEY